MPGRNGTGPMGMGPMTGRGMGCCGGRDAAQNAGRGRGLRARGGCEIGRGGYGRRNMFHATGLTGWQRAEKAAETTPVATPSPAMNVGKQTLEAQIEAMQSQLVAMKERLAEMEPGQ